MALCGTVLGPRNLVVWHSITTASAGVSQECCTIFATTKESSFSAHPSFDPSLPAPFKHDSGLRLLSYGSIPPADYFTHGGQFSHHV